MRKPQSVWSLD